MKKPRKTLKKAAVAVKRKPATRKKFPYDRIAKLWALGKTIPQIAESIGRVGKGDDPYHALRVALTRMHQGCTDAKGNVIRLPHRVSQKTVKLATKAGKKAGD
jgi:hypothetical protein